MFVATIFGGNDFVESIRIQHLFAGTVPPPRSPEYASRIVAAKEFSPTALTQGLNQILYFRENPDQAELALRAVMDWRQVTTLYGTLMLVAAVLFWLASQEDPLTRSRRASAALTCENASKRCALA